MVKIALVNTAGIKIWNSIFKDTLNAQVFQDDIFYISSVKELSKVKTLKRPFFSKYYLCYLEIEEGELNAKDFSNEFVIYVIVTKSIEIFEKAQKALEITEVLNCYKLSQKELKNYLRSNVPGLTDKAATEVMKKVGSKINKLDEVISKLTANENIKNYNTISVQTLLNCILLGAADQKCYKLVYNYKYNVLLQ